MPVRLHVRRVWFGVSVVCSGAGYLNPTGLFTRPMSGLPPGDRVWYDYCVPLYNQFDITYTGTQQGLCVVGGGVVVGGKKGLQ